MFVCPKADKSTTETNFTWCNIFSSPWREFHSIYTSKVTLQVLVIKTRAVSKPLAHKLAVDSSRSINLTHTLVRRKTANPACDFPLWRHGYFTNEMIFNTVKWFRLASSYFWILAQGDKAANQISWNNKSSLLRFPNLPHCFFCSCLVHFGRENLVSTALLGQVPKPIVVCCCQRDAKF